MTQRYSKSGTYNTATTTTTITTTTTTTTNYSNVHKQMMYR